MPKYAVAYSLLIVYSLSTAMATRLPHVARQGIVVGQPGATDLPSPALPPPSRPVTTIGPSPVTPPVSTTPTAGSSPSSNLSPSLSRSTLSPASSTTTPSTSQTPTSITSVSTNSEGIVQTVVTTVVAPTQDSTSSATPSSTQTSSDDNTIKPGTIIGLSVVGGVAVLSVVAFIVWKLTRKRFSDLDDSDDAIKWPELNREHPGGGDDLSRQASNPYPPSRNTSALDQSENDLYAVPPLPQFNPNQPYRDDPGAHGSSGYYDPYRGPVPQAFHDGSFDGHESIPMSTYPPSSRTRSPGPGALYDSTGRGSPVPGRASPAPGAMQDMGGRGTPLPGRTMSPGPVAAYGTDRRPSPGPQYLPAGQPEMVSRTNPGA